jgi:hypothetical protein
MASIDGNYHRPMISAAIALLAGKQGRVAPRHSTRRSTLL